MNKRIMTSIICIVMIGTLLAGCGVSGVKETSNDSSDAVTVSFSWWGNDKRHEYTMNGVDIFEEENPNISVKNRYGVWQGFEQRTRVAMESHTETDVMQINFAWISEYSSDGEGFYDLYKLSDIIDLSNYSAADLSYGEVDGKLNALPIAFNTTEFFYNKAIWDAYGLEFPQKWEDFFEAAKLMREDGIYPLGMVKKQVFMFMTAWFEQNYHKEMFIEDESFNLTKEEVSSLFDMYRRLIEEKVLIPIDDFDRTKFADGTVASTLCWVSDAGNYCTALEEKGGVPRLGGLLVEEDANRSGWYIKPATLYAISAYTEHPEEAAKLLDFLVNSPQMAELQLAEKGVPVSQAARETVSKIPDGVTGYEYQASEYMTEHMDIVNTIRPIMENDSVISAFKSFGDEYIFDQMTLEECAEGFINAVNDAQ